MNQLLQRRRVALVITTILLLTLTGCPKDKYKKAAIAGRDFAVAVRAIQQTEMALACKGPSVNAASCQSLVGDAEHQQFQTAFKETAQIGIQVDAVIRKGNAATEHETDALVQQALDSTQKLVDSTSLIKDERARAGVMSAVLAARIILGNIQLALGGATP